MSNSLRFRETDSTPEEDSYTWRVEWDDAVTITTTMMLNGESAIHEGSGYREYDGFDSAWDAYHYYRIHDDPSYSNVRLIRIDDFGNETQYAP